MTEPRSIVERYFAAFGAGDTEAALACVHPDAIWHVDGDPIVGTVGSSGGVTRSAPGRRGSRPASARSTSPLIG